MLKPNDPLLPEERAWFDEYIRLTVERGLPRDLAEGMAYVVWMTEGLRQARALHDEIYGERDG